MPRTCPNCKSADIVEPFESDGSWWDCAECEARMSYLPNGVLSYSTPADRAAYERACADVPDEFTEGGHCA